MSEIPFIHDLGNALDTAIVRRTSRSARRSGGRFQRGRSPRGVALTFVVVLLCGGGAAAAALLTSSQRLADGSVTCFFTTSGTKVSTRSPGASGPAVGQSPTSYCRKWYRLYAHAAGIDADTLGFVACRVNATRVDVYVADGRPEQCQRLGERSLPAAYAAAVARLRTLESRLDAIQERRACKSPQVIAAEVRGALTDLGFDAGRIRLTRSHPTPQMLNSPAGTGGTCGSLIFFPSGNAPSARVQLFPNSQLVGLTVGPPQKIATFVYRASGALYQRSYSHCYTATSIRALVSKAFAPASLEPRFATNAVPRGGGFLPASEKLYKEGCVRFEAAYVGDNSRFVDVSLEQRTAPSLRAGELFPPASAFRP
jgi:hypothetical protein